MTQKRSNAQRMMKWPLNHSLWQTGGWIIVIFFLFSIGLSFGKTERETPKITVLPFKLNQVKLLPSPFIDNRDKTFAYLKFIDADRLLYNFRKAAGIPTQAKPLGGWEKPDIKLRGHSVGHFMSALAQAYASTADPAFKNKLDYLVNELGKCQDNLAKKGYPKGFLSAYSPDQFRELERLTPYPKIWAPYYTLHKILAGLIAAYQLAANQKALDIAEKIGDWVYCQLKSVPESRLQEMWNLYIAGEYGGMNEVLAELYHITGEKQYLDTARKFDKKRLLEPCSENRDKISGLHANQHIPQVIGYLRIFDMTLKPSYYLAAKNFWDMVVGHHMYINGGVSDREMFKDPDRIASFITDKTCETCCAYNMLKLTRQLYCHDPRPQYIDYYERTLYNQILASQDPRAKHTSVTYFMPLNPGGKKSYSDDYHSFTCCHGTGMENHTKYPDSIYFHSTDLSTLYVNLYIPSILNWPVKNLKITQHTQFPFKERSTFVIKGSGQLKIKFRIPGWTQKGASIKINGIIQKLDIKPGTYVTLNRNWKNKDEVTVYLPYSLRLERTPDISAIGGIMIGPVLLVGLSDKPDWIFLDLDPVNLNQSITAASTPLEFITQGIPLVPMFKAQNQCYHSYFIIYDQKE